MPELKLKIKHPRTGDVKIVTESAWEKIQNIQSRSKEKWTLVEEEKKKKPSRTKKLSEIQEDGDTDTGTDNSDS
jgi:hypothetical protein